MLKKKLLIEKVKFCTSIVCDVAFLCVSADTVQRNVPNLIMNVPRQRQQHNYDIFYSTFFCSTYYFLSFTVNFVARKINNWNIIIIVCTR